MYKGHSLNKNANIDSIIGKNDTSKCYISLSGDGKNFQEIGYLEVSSNQDAIACALIAASPYTPVNY